jgi:hypothetical protein
MTIQSTDNLTVEAVAALRSVGFRRIWAKTPDGTDTVVIVVTEDDAERVSSRMSCGIKGRNIPGTFTVWDVLANATRVLDRDGCCSIRLLPLPSANRNRQAQESLR